MTARADAAYVGRFAPSPTGPLHFGSLLAAMASYLDARHVGGAWYVRIEDIDPPREVVGADAQILTTLERYGFEWDGPVRYQSENAERHRELASALRARGLAYPCGCSRKDLHAAPRGPLGTIYPGTCRKGTRASETALRLRTPESTIQFVDRLQGNYLQALGAESGDFVIVRRDGLIAYQLAVVADDGDQGITDIVRGIDLLPSTPRQIYLQRLLGFDTPRYAHIPVAQHADGAKLSKLTGATRLPDDRAPEMLHLALTALGQSPPERLAERDVVDIWHWAIPHWQPGALVGESRIALQHYL